MRFPRKTIFRLVFSAVLAALTLGLLEVSLRLLYAPELAAKRLEPAPGFFWQPDPVLGWTHKPGIEGTLTNGFFRGRIRIDRLGNRENGPASPFVPENDNLLFLGDSTVVSFEVADSDTVPGLLERALRQRGHAVNVINLGVRGYGTDQSVDKALRFAGRFAPKEAFYMFVDNDNYNNNVSKTPGSKYGKAVYLRPAGEDSFRAFNVPVPDYEPEVGEIVLLGPDCTPRRHATRVKKEGLPEKENESVLYPSYVYRAYFRFVRKAWMKARHRTRDPHRLVRDGVGWDPAFVHAHFDDGFTRNRCPGYFRDQMRFSLERLRAGTGVRRLHVVHFPKAETMARQQAGRSENVRMFEWLLAEGVVDGYVNLNRVAVAQSVDLKALRCPGDPHFCAQGNAWIVDGILAQTRFGDTLREAP